MRLRAGVDDDRGRRRVGRAGRSVRLVVQRERIGSQVSDIDGDVHFLAVGGDRGGDAADGQVRKRLIEGRPRQELTSLEGFRSEALSAPTASRGGVTPRLPVSIQFHNSPPCCRQDGSVAIARTHTSDTRWVRHRLLRCFSLSSCRFEEIAPFLGSKPRRMLVLRGFTNATRARLLGPVSVMADERCVPGGGSELR